MHAHTHMKHKHRHRPRQWKQQHQQATVKNNNINSYTCTEIPQAHAHTHRKLKHTEVDLRVHASVCVSVCLSACQRHWHSSGNARRNQSEVGHNQQFSYKTKSVFIQLENDIIQLNLQKREKQTRIKSPYFRNRPCSLQKCSLNIVDNGFLAFER